VPQRPYVLLSVATSIDGYIDDASSTRLVLSNQADLDRVDEVRAGCDAILVGAATIRRDNPALLVRSARRRAGRVARGWPASPAKVALTRTGNLDPRASFFTAEPAPAESEGESEGESEARPGQQAGRAPAGPVTKIVYVPSAAADQTRARLGERAQVVSAGEQADLDTILADLAARQVSRLLVEGGASVHAQFLGAGLADELHLVIAPLLVADPAAPRFAAAAGVRDYLPGRVKLAQVSQFGDVVLMRYLLSERAGR
jgi:5-amino-6-(5-phosphoribosylamino)uracil reductase